MCKQHGEKQKSVDVKEATVSLYYSGIRQVEISRRLNIPRTTITGVIKRFRRRGTVENIQRLGAPSKLSRRDTREILRSVKINRKRGLSDITAIFNKHKDSTVSKRTIQRKLYSEGYHRRVVRKRIRIREVNRKNRINWCMGNRHKTLDNYWKRVIFSDERKVDVGTDNRVFIWRKVGEDWHPCCLATPPTPKFSLMIWGCVTYNGVGTITVVDGNMNAQKYIETLDEFYGQL